MNLSNFTTNLLVDGLFRGGALNSSGTTGSSAVITGVWTATTAYTAGQRVVPHAAMTGAGGKFLLCTTGGTSGSTTTLAVPNPGTTLTDGSVTWTAVSGIPSPLTQYVALFTINKGLRASSTAYSVGDCISLTPQGGVNGNTNQHVYQCTTLGTTASSQPQYNGSNGEVVTDGTAVFTELSPVLKANTGFPAGLAEVSGGSYARVKLSSSGIAQLADWAGTQSTGSTTASTGTSSTTSNNSSAAFPSPTANWATGSTQVGVFCLYDALTGGNLLAFGALNAPKSVNNGDGAPTFAAAALTASLDN